MLTGLLTKNDVGGVYISDLSPALFYTIPIILSANYTPYSFPTGAISVANANLGYAIPPTVFGSTGDVYAGTLSLDIALPRAYNGAAPLIGLHINSLTSRTAPTALQEIDYFRDTNAIAAIIFPPWQAVNPTICGSIKGIPISTYTQTFGEYDGTALYSNEHGLRWKSPGGLRVDGMYNVVSNSLINRIHSTSINSYSGMWVESVVLKSANAVSLTKIKRDGSSVDVLLDVWTVKIAGGGAKLLFDKVGTAPMGSALIAAMPLSEQLVATDGYIKTTYTGSKYGSQDYTNGGKGFSYSVEQNNGIEMFSMTGDPLFSSRTLFPYIRPVITKTVLTPRLPLTTTACGNSWGVVTSVSGDFSYPSGSGYVFPSLNGKGIQVSSPMHIGGSVTSEWFSNSSRAYSAAMVTDFRTGVRAGSLPNTVSVAHIPTAQRTISYVSSTTSGGFAGIASSSSNYPFPSGINSVVDADNDVLMITA